jgi:hypothetical protein
VAGAFHKKGFPAKVPVLQHVAKYSPASRRKRMTNKDKKVVWRRLRGMPQFHSQKRTSRGVDEPFVATVACCGYGRGADDRRIWVLRSCVSATDMLPPPPAATPGPAPAQSDWWPLLSSSLYHPERFELRGGVFAHALASPEAGSVDANLELVAPRFFVIPWLPEYLTPRFHVGGIANFNGKTSYVYAGALWTFNLTQSWFVEGFFGGLIHNGNLDDNASDMNGLGCRWAFHSGGSIGYRLSDRWSVMGTFDHLSNGQICTYNKGINDYGLRAAYSF